MGLEVLFLSDFYLSESHDFFFLLTGVGVSDLLFCLFI